VLGWVWLGWFGFGVSHCVVHAQQLILFYGTSNCSVSSSSSFNPLSFPFDDQCHVVQGKYALTMFCDEGFGTLESFSSCGSSPTSLSYPTFFDKMEGSCVNTTSSTVSFQSSILFNCTPNSLPSSLSIVNFSAVNPIPYGPVSSSFSSRPVMMTHLFRFFMFLFFVLFFIFS